jgi:hypothetical protein
MSFARLALALALLAAAALPLRAQGSKAFENPEFGYRIKPPKEWTQVPLQLEEKWQTAKWLSDKPNYYTEPNGGWTREHKPELTVIAFVAEMVKRKSTVEKKTDDEGKNRLIIDIRNPYKDYLDYLKRTNVDGGFYVSDEKKLEIDGHQVTQYEIKIEKLTYEGPKRIVTWVHHTEDVDFAVQMVVFESAYEKLKKEIGSTQRSFGLIPRSAAGLATGDTGERVIIDERELSPEKRKESRVSLEKQAHAKAKDALTDGWDSFQVGRVLVLSHTDEKYARRVGEQATAVLDWCDETFPYVGPEEYVRQPVIRVCASTDEEMAYRKGSGGWYFVGERLAEIVTSNTKEGFLTAWEVDWVNTAVLSFWFQERDRTLYMALPDWLDSGLAELIKKSRVDKGKLEFRQDDYGRDQLRLLVKQGNAAHPRELLKLSARDFQGQNSTSYFGSRYQSGALLRFLLVGGASKSPRTRDVLRNYVKTLNVLVDEIEAQSKKEAAAAPKKPKTEEEEEEYFKQVNQGWKNRERKLLDEVFERCFRSWKESDWDDFAKVYFESV